jgi:sialidase-1
MANSLSTLRGDLRKDLFLSILQLVLALFFCLIFYIFLTSFGGEFLIVVKGLWILPVFLIILVGGTIISVILSAKSLHAGKIRGVLSERLQNQTTKSVFLIFWSTWNIVAIIPILLVGKVLALGALGSVPLFLIVILTLPFIGYAVMFAFSSVKTLLGLLQNRSNARLIRGTAISGFAFLFVFVSFGILSAFWNPQWTEGIQHNVLFEPGEEAGRGYRIPAMIVLPGDVVLAFAESRIDAMSDLLDINIVMKRSMDGGRTWSSLQVVEDMGQHTVHSPAPVYDNNTQTVWLPFCVDYKTLYLTESIDLGRTWSEPRNMSQEQGLLENTYCHNGPGNGIQMSTGRLVIPTSLNEPRVLYSDDHGVNWSLGKPIGMGSEPQVFERTDGSLCANLRSGRGKNRIMACSADHGETWEQWYYVKGLPDADTQASILRFTTSQDYTHDRLLFSNPGVPYRGYFTIRLSYDEGKTWPVSKLVYQGAAGYSQLAVLSDHTILALFEAGRYDLRESITLVRVSLGWLTDGTDQMTPTHSQ